jgi:HEAT repeat protein
MRFFKPNIKKMLKRKDIDGLLKAVEDNDNKIISAAIKAIGQIGDANIACSLVPKIGRGYGVWGE